jgi:hypothetical protein
MSRMRANRLLALGGLALAIGCRSHPCPPCMTPLMPEDVVNKPALTPVPIPTVPPPITGAKLPDGPGIQPPAAFTKLPDSRPPATMPSTNPDVPTILPPSDVAPLVGTPQTAPTPRTVPGPTPAPLIKPLLVEPPKPPPGPDGFAPAPIIGLPETPLPASPVATPQASVVKPLPLRPGEKFGHGTDYKWVAGVLDYHQKGAYWTLRYADSGDDDPWGGKFRLLADDRLTGLASGDVVYIEGELLAPRSAAETATFPPYRVTDVRTVDKGR